MIEKDVLISLIEKGFTRKQVAEELDVGYSTVHKYMSKYQLKFINTEKKITKFGCLTCGETEKNKFYGGRKIKCKSCFNVETYEKMRQNKIKGVKYKGGHCSRCGYSKSITALEFHHQDPVEKDPQWRIGWSWERLRTELDKCILLCANCHREVHEEISGVSTMDSTRDF